MNSAFLLISNLITLCCKQDVFSYLVKLQCSVMLGLSRYQLTSPYAVLLNTRMKKFISTSRGKWWDFKASHPLCAKVFDLETDSVNRFMEVCEWIRLMHSLVTSIFLYACDSWILTAEPERRIRAIEMRCYGKIHTKTLLPTRKSVPGPSRQLDHMEISRPS